MSYKLILPQVAMSERTLFGRLEEELAKIDPEILQYLLDSRRKRASCSKDCSGIAG